MQQHHSTNLIQEEQQRFNRLEKEEVVLKYKSISPLYYREVQENEQFEQRTYNFEPSIHYVIEQEAVAQGIRISKKVELVLVIKQKIVILPKTKPIVTKGVPMVVRVRYSEPRVNQQNDNINNGVPRDQSKGIHSVNIVPRPNSPRCTLPLDWAGFQL